MCYGKLMSNFCIGCVSYVILALICNLVCFLIVYQRSKDSMLEFKLFIVF